MYRIRSITHFACRLLAALAAAVLVAFCPSDPRWLRCGVRIGR